MANVHPIIAALAPAVDSVTIQGEPFAETDQSITVKTGKSLFEIPRESILNLSKMDSGQLVLRVKKDAHVLHTVLKTAHEAANVIDASAFGPALNMLAGDCKCDCRCECQCDCKCECHPDRAIGAALTATFRSPVGGDPGTGRP